MRISVILPVTVVSLAVLVAGASAQLLEPGFAINPPAPAAGILALAVGDVDTRELPNAVIDRPLDFSAQAHYIVMLNGPMTPARFEALAMVGAQLGDYLPMYAWVSDLGMVDPERLAELPFVSFVGEYRDEWKIDPTIPRAAYATPQRQALAAQGLIAVDITFHEGEPFQAALDRIGEIGTITVHTAWWLAGNPMVTAIMPLGDLPALAAINAVQFVEESPEITLRNDTNRWIVQSNQTNVTPFYDAGLHGEDQIVGILDGKVNVNHCSFHDPDNPIGPDHRKIVAYNTTNGSSSHGTHVAGIAVGDAGANNNTRGIAYLGRLAYNTIPSFNESSIHARFVLHHDQGARLHTNSWGDDGTTQYNSLCRGIDSFSYDYEDSLPLWAVTNMSWLKNPENAKNLLAVGASKDTPNQNQHCTGGAGPTSDQRRKPEIYAPGCSTNSSYGSGCSTTGMTGTSMASPLVAGTGLLVRQYFTDGYHPSGAPNQGDAFTPTAALIKATLLNGAVDMTGVSGYPSNREGWGRVIADEAAYFQGEARGLIVHDVRNADGLNTNDDVVESFQVNSSAEKLKVTLVFTDPPAAAGASYAPINDLDLEVVSPSGATYKGNMFSGGQSITGGNADQRNNVEQVHLESPETGTWTIRIRAAAVNEGTQGYAIAVSADISVESGLTADITDFAVVYGTLIGGNIARLEQSDDTRLRTRSALGFIAVEPNVMEIVIGLDTQVESPASLTTTIESRLNTPGGVATVRFRNFSTGLLEQVHQYATTTTESIEVIGGIDATNRVRPGDGRIELSIRHVVIAAFSLSGFDSFFDWVQVQVN